MYSECEVRQRGVVLIFALLVLLLLSLLTTAVMRGSVLQLRMARNIDSTALETQQALGEIERLLHHLGAGVPAGPRGSLTCTAS